MMILKESLALLCEPLQDIVAKIVRTNHNHLVLSIYNNPEGLLSVDRHTLSDGACEKIYMHDTRFPEMPSVGSIEYERIGDNSFSVGSRIIHNNRAKDERNKKYRTTANAAKVPAMVKEFVRPYKFREVWDTKAGTAVWPHREWIRELHGVAYAGGVTDKLNNEIANLVALGIDMPPGWFQELSRTTVPAWTEVTRRSKLEFVMHYVREMPDTRVLVVPMHKMLPNGYADLAIEGPHTFVKDMHSLPESLQFAQAMLQIADVDTFVPEVGIKLKNGVYYLLENLNN
jgi:hypothetical protein